MLTTVVLAVSACAVLAGNYECEDEYGDVNPAAISFPSEMSVHINDDQLKLDEWVSLPDDPDLVDRSSFASCTDGRLFTHYKASDINSRGEVTGSLEWQTEWEKTAEGVKAVSIGMLTPKNGAPVPLEGSFICTGFR